MNQYNSTFIGVQEAYLFQLNAIVANVPGYAWIGVGRDGLYFLALSYFFYRTGMINVYIFEIQQMEKLLESTRPFSTTLQLWTSSSRGPSGTAAPRVFPAALLMAIPSQGSPPGVASATAPVEKRSTTTIPILIMNPCLRERRVLSSW